MCMLLTTYPKFEYLLNCFTNNFAFILKLLILAVVHFNLILPISFTVSLSKSNECINS